MDTAESASAKNGKLLNQDPEEYSERKEGLKGIPNLIFRFLICFDKIFTEIYKIYHKLSKLSLDSRQNICGLYNSG